MYPLLSKIKQWKERYKFLYKFFFKISILTNFLTMLETSFLSFSHFLETWIHSSKSLENIYSIRVSQYLETNLHFSSILEKTREACTPPTFGYNLVVHDTVIVTLNLTSREPWRANLVTILMSICIARSYLVNWI